VLVRLRVAEQDERVIAEIPVHEPLVPIGRLRYAALKAADPVAPVFEIYARDSRYCARQLARQGGDLATFGFPGPDRHGVPRSAGPRWWRYGAILLANCQPQAR
jgi:hypothetical protein